MLKDNLSVCWKIRAWPSKLCTSADLSALAFFYDFLLNFRCYSKPIAKIPVAILKSAATQHFMKNLKQSRRDRYQSFLFHFANLQLTGAQLCTLNYPF